jgi:hypothetical protein
MSESADRYDTGNAPKSAFAICSGVTGAVHARRSNRAEPKGTTLGIIMGVALPPHDGSRLGR